MFRVLILLGATVIALSGVVIGYVAANRTIDHSEPASPRPDVEQSANAFYELLGTIGDGGGMDDLAAMLAPDFTERRLELQQTLDRAAFLQTVAQERVTNPDRQFVPIALEGDGEWAMAVLQTAESDPGAFAGIALPESSHIRREMLRVVDGRIAERVVLEGQETGLRSLPPVRVSFEGTGKQTIEIVRRRYDPQALERIVLEGPGSVVVESGAVTIGTPGIRLGAGDEMTVRAGNAIAIKNDSDTPASLLVLTIAPIDMPRSIPSMSDQKDAGPGVTAQRIGQTTAFLPAASCFTVERGLASLAPGNRLPRHRTGGYEFLIPLAGQLDASSETHAFLRTDSVRSWQDETSFATVENGIALAALPGSWTAYSVTSDEPALAWVFAVTFDATDCPFS